MEAPATPPTARRRGFSFFGKASGSNDNLALRSNGSRLSYQPRVKGKRGIDVPIDDRVKRKSTDYPEEAESGPSTPRAGASSLSSPSSPKLEGRKMLPHRLQLTSSAMRDSSDDAGQEAEDSRELAGGNDTEQTPKVTPQDRSAKWRQASLGLDGLARWSEKRATGLPPTHHQHARKASWSSREILKRRVSSPLEGPATDAGNRAPLAGAKPVAPSYHPDAPPELKVRTPTNAVLLPFLSIPGNARSVGSPAGPDLISPTSPPDFQAEDVIHSTSVKHQRPGIKVRIITWNQGNSVPKGDLEVLLGRVGEYIAPQEGWDDSDDETEDGVEDRSRTHKGMGVAGQEKVPRMERIPPLPHDDAHPYHIVVVAGQECPWGDGKRIATGVGLAGELGDLSRSKSRAAQMAKEKRESKGAKEAEEKGGEDKNLSSSVENEFPFSDVSSRQSVPSTPLTAVPSTPGGAGLGAGWGIGGKGWSDMCEDWLCRGPLAQATATKGLAQASRAAPSSPMLLSPAETPEASVTPAESRATTPVPQVPSHNQAQPSLTIQTDISDEPKTATPTKKADASAANSVTSQDHYYKSPLKSNQLAVPRPGNAGRSISFASRSREDLQRKAAMIGEEEEDTEALGTSPATRPISPLKEAIDVNTRIPAHQNRQILPGKPHHRLGIHIPGLSASHHITVQSDGTPLSLGAYELVAKERCYMMYMAVYVWRGCLDRVGKTSQGHVKSGLLAGRVGNKGAVGISLKLGSSRLLFVNAHLAAHEGKVAERIANVEKIKAELKVDTFLPAEDPRNKADDVTDAFDYAFWFGDLNFRVDISRRHADWLLMKKQYQDALAFDQLKKVMKEQPNVFKSFHEASINFPPTFKYDVLKTIKQKREEKARKHKSASAQSKLAQDDKQSGMNGNSGGEGSKGSRSIVSSTSQSSVKQGWGDGSKNVVFPTRSRASSGQRYEMNSERDGQSEGLDDDTSSVSSSAWGGSALSTSAGQISDREEVGTSLSSSHADSPQSAVDPVVSSNTAAAEGHALHGRAIKVKRRILGVVHAIGGHSPQKNREGHLPALVKSSRQGQQTEAAATDGKSKTQEQVVSAADVSLDEAGLNIPPSSSFSKHSRNESSSSLKILGLKPSDNSSIQQGMRRRRSSAGEISPSSPAKESWLGKNGEQHTLKPSTSMTAMLDEYEKQPYDTSAKQRVPSWCDRVLWKSNITVETEANDAHLMSKGVLSNLDDSYRTRNRKASALSHAFHPERRKRDKRRSVSFLTERRPSSRKSLGTPLSESYAPDETSSRRALSPRRRWFHRKSSDSQIKRSATFDYRNVECPSGAGEDGRFRKRTMSAVELPLAQKLASSPSGDVDFRKSRNSLHFSPRQLEGASSSQKSYIQNASNSNHQQRPQDVSPAQVHHALAASPTIRGAQLADAMPESGNGSARKFSWWNDLVTGHLPSLFTPSGAMTAFSNLSGRNDSVHPARSTDVREELAGPRRGEVECLLYKSLDDREMRLLEGRSDHRPVIWVGSIGV